MASQDCIGELSRHHSVNVEKPKPNGSDAAPSPPPSRAGRRSRLGRTLFTAGVFALLAMIYVPVPMYDHGHRVGGGYRFVFDKSDTSVAFFQLLINVAFAAALGAIAANLSSRARWVSGCVVVVAIAGFTGPKIAERAWLSAEAEERYAERSFVRPFGANEIARAQEHFRNAAFNWRLALQFQKAGSAEARANGATEEAKRKEELERLLAQQREFKRQWESNAQKVIEAHPDLGYENSLYARAMKKVLSSNTVYSQRVDGFELAYKVIMKQLPPPGNMIPTTEFYRLLDDLKTDPPAMIAK
jgi:hypothetical protein